MLIKYYFTLAIRRMVHMNKVQGAVAILGLALSMAASILLFRYVYQETTVDHCIPDHEKWVFLTQKRFGRLTPMDNNKDFFSSGYIDPLDTSLVEKVTKFIPLKDIKLNVTDFQVTTNALDVDSNFHYLIPLRTYLGKSYPTKCNEITISKELSVRLFDKKNPIGKIIKISSYEYQIVGVFNKPSDKISLEFDALLGKDYTESLGRFSLIPNVMAKLTHTTDINRWNASIPIIMAEGNGNIHYQVISLDDIYFSSLEALLQQRANKNSVYILLGAAILLLIVGIFNYLNLHNVMMLSRWRNIGVRHVFGASNSALFMQLWTESLCSLIIVLSLAWTFIEIISGITERYLDFHTLTNIKFDVVITAILIISVSLIETSMSWYNIYHKPTSIQLGSVGRGGVSLISRMGFLFVEYLISFALITLGLYFMVQINYIRNFPLGYNPKNIIQCKLFEDESTQIVDMDEWNKLMEKRKEQVAQIKDRLSASPLFGGIAFCENYTFLNNEFFLMKMGYRLKENDETSSINMVYMPEDYRKMLGIKLKRNPHSDINSKELLLMNETAIKKLGIKDWINQKIFIPEQRYTDEGFKTVLRPATIDGVINDFRYGKCYNGIEPLGCVQLGGMKDPTGDWRDPMNVRITPTKEKEAIAYLKKIYEEINGNSEFHYNFLEDDIRSQYKQDQQVMNVYLLFAGLAILISTMGLFALSLFDIKQRYREIALRKVNGAKLKDILPLLIKKYLIIQLTAFIVSIPVVLWVIHQYTRNMVDYAHPAWWMFTVALIMTMAMAMATLISQIYKATNMNPAEVLKNE